MDIRCRITSGGRKPRDSATENRPPLPSLATCAEEAVRVTRCGKSAPRLRQRRRHGKPHREQDRIGTARGRVCESGSGPGSMSGSGRPGRLLKAPGNRRRRGMAVTRGRKPSPYRTRLTGWLMRFKGARRKNPPGPRQFFGDCALAIGDRALRAELPVGVDHGLAVGACLSEPLCGEALADLLQAGLQGLAWRQYFQTVGGELLAVPFVLIL